MKKLLKIFLNLITFGIPLFVDMLTKSIKFKKLINNEIRVSVNLANNKVNLMLERKPNCIMQSISLEIDYIYNEFGEIVDREIHGGE